MIQINPNRKAENVFPDSTPKKATNKFTTLDGGLINALTLEMSPVQDLHGYSKPWPGGAGKNKLAFISVASVKANNTNGTWSDDVYTYKDITFELKFDTDGNFIGVLINGMTTQDNADFNLYQQYGVSINPFVSAGNYTISSNSNDIDVVSGYANTPLIRTTGPASGNCSNGLSWAFFRVAKNVTFTNFLVQPMIRLSSIADPTFEPYSNICPISGHTDAESFIIGKNKFNTNTQITGSSLFSGTDDDFTISGTGANQATAFVVDVQPNTNYTLSCSLVLASGKGAIAIASYDNTSTIYTSSTYSESQSNISFSFNSASETKLRVKCFCTRTTSESGNANYKKMMIRLSSDTDSTFEPYVGQTYTTSLGTTVYGGEVDQVSGDGKVTWSSVDLGSLTWTYTSGRFRSSDTPANIALESSIRSANGLMVEIYNPSIEGEDETIFKGNTGQIYIYDSRYTDAATFKTAMSGIYLVYAIATPTTLSLTGQNITAEVGVNNVSAPGTNQEIVEDGVTYKEMFSWQDVVDYVQSQVNP